MHRSITDQRINDAVSRRNLSLDNPGFCIICGADADGCEPDARHYECESCGEPSVFGAEEFLFGQPTMDDEDSDPAADRGDWECHQERDQ